MKPDSSPLVLKQSNSLYKNTDKSLGLVTNERWENDNFGGYNLQETFIYYGSGDS